MDIYKLQTHKDFILLLIHKHKMSNSGQLLRGEKWYSQRDIDGNLPELTVSMKEDVELYLASKEKVTPTKSKGKK